jgi:hypothetical protein
MNNKTLWLNQGTFSYNGISGISFSCDSNDCSINDQFDLGIFFSSFESRALFSSLQLAKNSCKYSLIIFFSEASDSELRRKHDPIILDQVKNCSENAPICIRNISIKKLKETLNRIINSIPKKVFSWESKWFIDLGGAPTPYFLGLLGFLKNLSLPPHLTLFNPTGNYEISENNNQVFHFTSGFEKNTYIPNFWGIRDEALPRKFIFMLGHDEYRSYKIYEQQEPDEIEVFITSPGYKPEYEKIALERNKKFLDECNIKPSEINRSCAANISDTINKLKEIISNSRHLRNICLVPLGVKAHSLSCGICSLAEVFPSVLYNMPKTYKIKDTKAGDKIWKYEINL